MNAVEFRQNFPEFSDASAYPTSQIEFWIGVAEKRLRPDAWADLIDQGIQLFTAHNIALSAMNARSGSVGGSVGQNSGPIASKSIGDVSVSYDAGLSSVEGAGGWNMTTYGVQFYQLSQIVGIGVISDYGTGAAYPPSVWTW